MPDNDDRTEELSRSALDVKPSEVAKVAILRCVDTSVLRGTGGKEIKLGTTEVTIGRGSENTLTVDGIGMSRLHARVFFSGNDWHVEDLGSTNGTRINNSNISSAVLNDGDTVAFGRVCYKFVKLDAVPSPRTLDLGMDHTLVLAPNERPGGGNGANARTSDTARRASSVTASGRYRSSSAAADTGSGLGIWVAVVVAALAVVIGAMLLLS